MVVLVYHLKVLSEAAERKGERIEKGKGGIFSIKRHICNVLGLAEGYHPSATSCANQAPLQSILGAGKQGCFYGKFRTTEF